ncbi:MAG TPA: hypothetical protein EYH36_07585 [Desulfocapsa sulfexigens]|nr:hypothetical protein [Desulfocapsa sulfexigens]
MNTQEKIDLATNERQLTLHREGAFYKLYNQQAMLFTENIKTLKIKVKFIRLVNQHVYSCGFPVTIIEDVKKQLSNIGGAIDESEGLLTVAGIDWKKKGDYSKWCKEQKQAEVPAKIKSESNMTNIEKQIAGFQVMRKTPMEAMDFIVELQGKLNGIDECEK